MLLADRLIEQSHEPAEFARWPKFDVSNVARYYLTHDKEYWVLGDFPLPHPPYDEMWCEYRMPPIVCSKGEGNWEVYLSGYTIYFGAIVYRKEDSFNICGMYYTVADQGREKGKVKSFSEQVSLRYWLDGSGTIEKSVLYSNKAEVKSPEEYATMAYCTHPILMAFTFCNCKNAEVVTVRASDALQKARAKRGVGKLHEHRIINILPFGKVFEGRRRTVVSDGKLAVEIRAGNYARYGPKFNRGLLFGKYEGLFWRPSILAGDKAVDYNIKLVGKT